jgi:hypothetical protein
MSFWYDPKTLTDALELDYVQRPRLLHLWQRRLLWSAGACALLYVAWVLWPSHHAALEAGPVSTPHAMFNQDCGKCHTDAFATMTRLAPSAHPAHSTPDRACLECHPGPQHNQYIKAKNCASCHREHRGHQLLARPSDPHCTRCHANFKEQYSDVSHFENVPSFAAHPEFAVWRDKLPTDPGNVEFNHHKHLQLRVGDNLTAITRPVAMLQQMQCAYCHQPDPAGKYMRPIQFDAHCQACHSLGISISNMDVAEQLKPAVQAFQKEPVPHPKKGQTAWNVRAVARERYLKFAQEHAPLLQLKSVALDDWMILPGLPRRGEPATQQQIDWVNVQWQHAESLLFDKKGGCARCHAELSKPDRRDDGLPQFGKPHVPSRWLKHSVFDHHAHRMHACTVCHQEATTSTRRQDVLMPKVAQCQTCHQSNKGFARADCVECHLFHHP